MGFGDLLGGVGSVIGGIVGNSEASGDQEAAKAQMLAALAQMQGVSVPQLQEMLAQSQAGQSATETMDPSGRNAQLSAINYMQNAANQGGYTMADRVAQEQAMQKAAQYEQGQRGAITQEMAARGQMGGGGELAAKLAAQQAGTTNAYGAASSAAANAQMRALEEMQTAGTMGQGLTQTDLAKSQAQDMMNRFNASQRGNAYQNQFNDQMAKASGVANANNNMAGYYGGAAQRTRNQATGIGQGIGSLAGGAADLYASGGLSALNPFGQKKQDEAGWDGAAPQMY